MERRTFARGMLAVPLGVAGLATVASVGAAPSPPGQSPYRRIPVTSTDGAFSGALDLTHVNAGAVGTAFPLVAVGALTGTLTRSDGGPKHVKDLPVAWPATLAGPGLAQATGDVMVATQQVCPILNLVLGELHLDLLGLVVDLNQVVLAITAAPGAGNLLGNLLCAIAGLLDGVGLGDLLSNLLGEVAGLLSAIIAILNG